MKELVKNYMVYFGNLTLLIQYLNDNNETEYFLFENSNPVNELDLLWLCHPDYITFKFNVELFKGFTKKEKFF